MKYVSFHFLLILFFIILWIIHFILIKFPFIIFFPSFFTLAEFMQQSRAVTEMAAWIDFSFSASFLVSNVTEPLDLKNVSFFIVRTDTASSQRQLCVVPLRIIKVHCLKCHEYTSIVRWCCSLLKSLGIDRGLELLTSMWENRVRLGLWKLPKLSREMIVMTRQFACRGERDRRRGTALGGIAWP